MPHGQYWPREYLAWIHNQLSRLKSVTSGLTCEDSVTLYSTCTYANMLGPEAIQWPERPLEINVYMQVVLRLKDVCNLNLYIFMAKPAFCQ